MLQRIDGKTVEVVEFDTLPELPVTGLTPEEEMYERFTLANTLGGLGKSITYAQILTDAIETEVITEPGKYGLYKVPGGPKYEVFKIIEE